MIRYFIDDLKILCFYNINREMNMNDALLDVYKKDIPGLLRNARINKILNDKV